MKTVKFFLASSIDELRGDRAAIGDFFRQLNKSSEENHHTSFILDKCDDFDNAISHEKKQLKYDGLIRESDTCIFLFSKKVGEFTRHEFEVALSSFKEKESPKIITFFKQDNEPDSEEVSEFKNYLSSKIGHYYTEYSDIDSVKYNILMHIQLFNLDAYEVSVSDGAVKINGHSVLNIDSVPSLTSLSELTKKKKALQEKVIKLKKALIEDPCDDDILDELADSRIELSKVSSQLTTAERESLELASTIAEYTSSGKALTYRQKEALKFFNAGDYKKSLIFFQDKERDEELKRAKNRINAGIKELEGYVSDELLYIQIIKTKGITKENIPLICGKYEGICDLVQSYNLDRTPLYEYALFLFEQNQNYYKRAIKVAEKAWFYYSSPHVCVDPWEKSKLLVLLGNLYKNTRNFENASKVYNEALAIRLELAKSDTPEAKEGLAESHYCLGLLYKTQAMPKESKEQFFSSIEIREDLFKLYPDAYGASLASSYNSLAVLLREEHNYKDCSEYFSKAVSIREALCKKYPERYTVDLARTYNGLAVLYRLTHKYSDSEEMFLKVIKIREALCDENPEAYDYDLSASYNGLGALYRRLKRYGDAEKMLSHAIKLRELICNRNFDACAHDLASSYSAIADLYSEWGKTSSAKDYYTQALDIYKEESARQGDIFAKNITYIENCLKKLL